jgi:hypothetical protein
MPSRASLAVLAAAAAAAFLPAPAAAAPRGSIRVALYVGGGTAAVSSGNLTAAIETFVTDGTIKSCTTMNETEVAASLTTAAYDLFVVPGGSGGEESDALGPAGKQAVLSFVAGGGGYYGTCAGGFLASNESCCWTSMPGYCGGATGCAPSPTSFKLMDLGVAEPWDRGHGVVTMRFNDAGAAALQLPAAYTGVDIDVLYWQGPIASRLYPSTGFAAWANFTSEIAINHPQWTTGEMLGAPALMTTTYGQGRVLVSPPHPEQTAPRLDVLIKAYVLWAAGAI